MVSLLEVAKLANVSTATVSRTMSAPDRVRAKTRARVMAAIEALGYQPSCVAQSLRTGRGLFAALVTGDIEHGIYPELAKLVQFEMEAIHLHLVLFNLAHQQERLVHILENAASLGLRGILLAATDRFDLATLKPLIEKARSRGVLILNLIQPLEGAGIDAIMPDNRLGSKMAVQHLFDRGRRRIAFLARISGSAVGHERLQGYKAAIQELGLPVEPARIWDVTQGFRGEAGYLFTNQALSRNVDVDAIVAASDELAGGAIAALLDRGLTVPDAVSVTGFGGTRWGAYFRPALSTIDLDIANLARQARLWFEAIESGVSGGPQRILIPPRLIVRDST